MFDKVRENSRKLEKVGGSRRKSEKVRESSRKLEKVGEGSIKFDKVRESSRKFEKVMEFAIRCPGFLRVAARCLRAVVGISDSRRGGRGIVRLSRGNRTPSWTPPKDLPSRPLTGLLDGRS